MTMTEAQQKQLRLKLIRILRKTTGAPLAVCVKAIDDAKCDLPAALEIIRRRGTKICPMEVPVQHIPGTTSHPAAAC